MRYLVASLMIVAGCRGPLIVECSGDQTCVSAGLNGRCTRSTETASHFCAFADTSCPSGFKWDGTAGDGLGGQCYGAAKVDGGAPSDLSMMPGDDMPMSVDDMSGPTGWMQLNSGTGSWLFGVGGVDDNGTIRVWTGGQLGDQVLNSKDENSWQAQTLPMGSMTVNAIAAANATLVIAVGDAGAIYRYDGAVWGTETSPTTDYLNAVWCADTGECFAVGDSGTILHRAQMAVWSVQPVPPACQNTFHGVYGLNVNELVAVGYNGTVCRTTDGGNTWTPQFAEPNANFSGVWGSAGGWFVSTDKGYVLRSPDGVTWAKEQVAAGDFWGVWGSSADDVYIVGGLPSVIYHYDGTKWDSQPVPVGGEELNAIWGASANSIFVVGHNGTILHGP